MHSSGPTVLLGLGGIYAEALRDFSIRICPIRESDANEMIEELKSKSVFTARGKEYDKAAIAKLLVAVSDIATKEQVKELDLNPVILYPKGSERPYVVVDARVVR